MGRRVFLVVFASFVALVAAGRASAFTQQDLSLSMSDGVQIAATLYEPSNAPPPAGYPAVVALHGLGGKRQDLDFLAQAFANSFAVLTFDQRGHGQSGGLVSIDGPREIADLREIHDWLAARPEIDRSRIGAWGLSLGGGAVLRSLVEGVPWAAVETVETWTDLYSALIPQGLSKSGALRAVPELDPAEQDGPLIAGDPRRRAREHRTSPPSTPGRMCGRAAHSLRRSRRRCSCSRAAETSPST